MISAPKMNKQIFFVNDVKQAEEFNYDKKLNILNGNPL